MSSRLLASVWIECNYCLGVRQPMKYLLISLHFSIFIILSLTQTKTKILEAFLELSFWIRKISHRLQQRHPSCPSSDSAPSECIWKGTEWGANCLGVWHTCGRSGLILGACFHAGPTPVTLFWKREWNNWRKHSFVFSLSDCLCLYVCLPLFFRIISSVLKICFIFLRFIIHLKVKVTEREAETERGEIFPPLIRSPGNWNVWGRARLWSGDSSRSPL